jgi:hypothetical protein
VLIIWDEYNTPPNNSISTTGGKVEIPMPTIAAKKTKRKVLMCIIMMNMFVIQSYRLIEEWKT